MSLLLKRPQPPRSDHAGLIAPAVRPVHFAPPLAESPQPSLQHRPEEPPASFCDELPSWLKEQLQEAPLLQAPGTRCAQIEYRIGRVEDFIEEDNEVELRLRRLLSEQYDEHWEEAPEGSPQPAPCDRAALVRWSELQPDGAYTSRQRLFIDPVVVSDDELARWRLLLEEAREEAEASNTLTLEPPQPEPPQPEPPQLEPLPNPAPEPAPSLIRRCDRITPDQIPDDQLTLITYGPGSGEAMIVKLPDGRFGVVDGCERKKGRATLGVVDNPVWDFLQAVPSLCETGSLAFVAWTHPHDDHWGGLGGLVKHFQGRIERLVFVADCYGRVGEVIREAIAHHVDPEEVQKLAAAVQAFRDYQPRTAFRRFSLDGHILSLQAHQHSCRIVACGPHEADTSRAFDDMVTRDQNGKPLFKYKDHPNLLSGALLVEWGTSRIVLGGDLLVGQQQGGYLGWGGVLESECIPSPVQVVKVAHHASEGAHEVALWSYIQPCLAIVTPFKRAATRQDRENPSRRLPFQPPKPDDIARILNTGARVVITTPPQWLGIDPAWPERCWEAQAPNSPPPADHNPIYNAVAVSMDAHGNITQILLGGEADFYQLPRVE